MRYEFKAFGPNLRIETDDRTLRIRSLFLTRRIEWSSIVGAGPLAPSPALILPSLFMSLFASRGHKALADKAQSVQRASTRVWLAYKPHGRVRLRCLTLPRSNESTALVEEFRSHLADRWEEAVAPGVFGLRREFGLSNRWFWPKAILFVISALILLLLGVVAWAAVLAVIADVRVALVIIFVAAIWWLYKQFHAKPSV